jgi:hypothetical protein
MQVHCSSELKRGGKKQIGDYASAEREPGRSRQSRERGNRRKRTAQKEKPAIEAGLNHVNGDMEETNSV